MSADPRPPFSRRPLAARRRLATYRRLATALLAGCALTLASGPTVLAKGGHGADHAAAPGPQSAPGQQGNGASHGQAHESQGKGGSSGSGAGAGQSPQSASPPATSSSPTGQAQGGKQASGGKGAKGHGPQSASKQTPAPGPASATPTLASSSPVAAAASVAPAPVAATPASAAVSVPAAVAQASRPASHRVSRARRAGSRRAHRAHRAARAHRATGPAASAPFVGRGSAAPALGRGDAGARRVVKRAPKPSTATQLAPLVKTVTRIVGIVPLPMRILIGLLLAAVLALGLRSRLVERRARRLERQRGELLEDVGLLQAALLPAVPERLGPVRTSAAYRPAEGPGAGGDFYDVFALEGGQVAAVVGDISGHGRRALPHTALVRFTLRAYLEAGLEPREALQTAGVVLERQLGESFATVALAVYQPRERVLTYACAGHPPPVVLGSALLRPITVCAAPPLATGMRTGTRQTTVSLDGAAQVCLYTDGLTEARVGGELFGGERLTQALDSLGSSATAPALLDEVSRAADARPDDMAACLLSVEGGASPPQVLLEELELGVKDAASDRTKRFLLACGLPRREVAALLPLARAQAERAGTVLLGVGLEHGEPEVALRRNNVAPLHVGRARRKAVAG